MKTYVRLYPLILIGFRQDFDAKVFTQNPHSFHSGFHTLFHTRFHQCFHQGPQSLTAGTRPSRVTKDAPAEEICEKSTYFSNGFQKNAASFEVDVLFDF